jgi:hypothetical protein
MELSQRNAGEAFVSRCSWESPQIYGTSSGGLGDAGLENEQYKLDFATNRIFSSVAVRRTRLENDDKPGLFSKPPTPAAYL